MKKVILFGHSLEEISPLIKKYGFVISSKKQDADFVICYGGDGTFINAGRRKISIFTKNSFEGQSDL